MQLQTALMDAQSSLDAITLTMATSAMVRQVDVVQERVSSDGAAARIRFTVHRLRNMTQPSARTSISFVIGMWRERAHCFR
jgi:hypothetical protein